MSRISELFDLDPLKLTRDDVGEIVDHMRQARAQFITEGAKPKAPKAPKDTKAADDILKELNLL
jgi:hypothetical protein